MRSCPPRAQGGSGVALVMEQRKKTHSVLLSVNSKNMSIELFPAGLWPDQAGAEGLYRLRIDGAWHCPAGKYSFIPLDQVGALLGDLLAGGMLPAPPPCPEGFESPVRVSVPLENCEADAQVKHDCGWTVTPPHLGPDGRWWVWVSTYDGKRLCPCDDVIRR